MEYNIHKYSPSAYLDRLEKLMKERLQPGANKEAIDARIWDVFGETRAVMFTDLSGFSRSVKKFGIIHFLQIIYESKRIFIPFIDKYDGIVVKFEGDSMLVIFRQPTKAIACAIEMQQAAKVYNQNKPDTEKILLCVGLGYGEILNLGDYDVFGAEVNAASKLGEDTANSWEILITPSVAEYIPKIPDLGVEKLEYVPPGAEGSFRLIYPL
ncbi:MAG: adenylate/guanylate cyclase domain-containing protein [Geitlerinemataceae cyanobacterium]